MASSPNTSSGSSAGPAATTLEVLDLDDRCPICHNLLFVPATTDCNHTACRSCLAHWAAVSSTSLSPELSVRRLVKPSIPAKPLRRSPDAIDQSESPSTELQVNCPMCRTSTKCSINHALKAVLKDKYPRRYAEREVVESDDNSDARQINTRLAFGNTHRLVQEATERAMRSHNRHEWTLFLQSSHEEMIEEVEVLLHPTFRPPSIRIAKAPFRVRRLGWGVFIINIHVYLKPGYTFDDPAAFSSDRRENSPKNALAVEWLLDFQGYGAVAERAVKIRISR